MWFLSGMKSLDFLQEHTSIWNVFSNDDNDVEAAYGYRWRHHFKRDQILSLLKLLEGDPTSRQGVVIAWDPGDDGLSDGSCKKNVPCPFAFTVQIMGKKLSLHLIMRSNDMILGHPHDIAGFALLSHMLAQRLNVGVGVLSISISDAHIYEAHKDVYRKLLQNYRNSEGLNRALHFDLPPESLERALGGDGALVNEIVQVISEKYSHSGLIRGIKLIQ